MIPIPRRLLAVAAVALLAAGCSDTTGSDGTPSTLVARAYVDTDGSGAFNTGDAPIAGAQITLLARDGSGPLQATTGADGSATFQGVRPGTYELSFTGNAPAGSVLASAVTPVVVAPVDGGQVGAEFRFAFRPGSLSGVVFRDENGNGTFDAGTDTPAPGVPVRLYAGGAAGGDPVATTVTADNGSYSFTGVRPGAYTLELVPGPAMQFVGGSARQVTVAPDGATSVPVRFTGQLLVSIAAAKQRPVGATVVVDGVVTANQGVFGPTAIYIQDPTSGIQVFRIPASVTGLVEGDSVRVTGGLRLFSGEAQVDTTNGGAITVEKLGTVAPKTPRVVTGAQIAARTFEGQLARVNGVQVTAVSGTAASTSYNVTVRAPDGTVFTVRVAAAGVAIPQPTFVVGQSYNIVGVLGSFNGAAQLKPRSLADVTAA